MNVLEQHHLTNNAWLRRGFAAVRFVIKCRFACKHAHEFQHLCLTVSTFYHHSTRCPRGQQQPELRQQKTVWQSTVLVSMCTAHCVRNGDSTFDYTLLGCFFDELQLRDMNTRCKTKLVFMLPSASYTIVQLAMISFHCIHSFAMFHLIPPNLSLAFAFASFPFFLFTNYYCVLNIFCAYMSLPLNYAWKISDFCRHIWMWMNRMERINWTRTEYGCGNRCVRREDVCTGHSGPMILMPQQTHSVWGATSATTTTRTTRTPK